MSADLIVSPVASISSRAAESPARTAAGRRGGDHRPDPADRRDLGGGAVSGDHVLHQRHRPETVVVALFFIPAVGDLLVPRVMKNTVDISSLPVLVSALIGAP